MTNNNKTARGKLFFILLTKVKVCYKSDDRFQQATYTRNRVDINIIKRRGAFANASCTDFLRMTEVTRVKVNIEPRQTRFAV